MKTPPLEAGLVAALQALDHQITREMQRTPAQRTEHGMTKWEPLQKRIELVSTFVLEQLEADQVSLDAVLVLTQAMSKALQLTVTELGREDLGEARSQYCLSAAENLARDAERMQQAVNNTYDLM